jgi:hypothetical protein
MKNEMKRVKEEWKRVTGEGLLCLSRVWCSTLIAEKPSTVGEKGSWEMGRVGFTMQLMKLKLQDPSLARVPSKALAGSVAIP